MSIPTNKVYINGIEKVRPQRSIFNSIKETFV